MTFILFRRRVWIVSAMILMVASLIIGNTIAAICILVALGLLGVTIASSLMHGCGAAWAGFWFDE